MAIESDLAWRSLHSLVEAKDGSGNPTGVPGRVVVNYDGSPLDFGGITIGTVDQGTAGSAAGGWYVKITDGTNTLGTSSHALRIDPTGATAQPITASSLPLPTNASKETGGNLDTLVTNTTGLALDATLTGGTQKTLVYDGTNVVFTAGHPAYIQGTITSQIYSASRNDTYTTTGNGTAITLAAPCKYFSIQVTGTGAAASLWDVRLEGSLDGVSYTTLITHTNTDGDGKVDFLSSAQPVLYIRSRCAGLTLGTATNIVVKILGVQ